MRGGDVSLGGTAQYAMYTHTHTLYLYLVPCTGVSTATH